MLAFCNVDTYEFGPVQAKLAPGKEVAVKFKVAPEQIGPLLEAVIVGTGFTVTVKLTGAPTQLFAVAVTVILAITGDVVLFVAKNVG
jgi:hypothetical protein